MLTTAAGRLSATPPAPHGEPPSPAWPPRGDAGSAAALLRLLTQPPAALAATDGSSSGMSAGAAAKMERVRQLATPDVAGMKEVSEELAGREAPPGATVTPAAASSSSGSGKQQQQQQSDPKSKVKAADLAALLRVSPDTAKSLLASERELGRLSVGAATSSFKAAAELLGLYTPPPSSAAAAGAGAAGSTPGGLARQAERDLVLAGRLLARQPRVLLVPAAELRARFGELQSLLLVPVATARKLVAAQPGLLAHSPEVLRGRLSGLCGTFNVDTQLASQLAVHEPALLAANAAELSTRASALASELGLTRPQVVAVIRRHPRSLLVAADAMRSRLRKLAELLEVPRGGDGLGRVVLAAPRLVLLGEGEVEKNLEGLRGLLKISRDRAVEVAAEVPALLTTPGPVLAERLKTLGQLAGVPVGQVRALVEAKPSLLTKTSTAMKRAVAEAEAEEAREAAEAEAQAGGGKGGSKGGR
ncbi:hypothetical protein HXX76_013867 [Chlamydomonas incerta]|uniref:Mitochondrial transcription termination factor n=1 Tax=Chlamydomonas incerta TaxID=51695 RepID=A0A835SSV9_CHLIN|nr:hypothetical protein HXX76_013867 [Chlamydomonas incerta]|eukprot:KAG2425286.1 hypothetical protein HXX76_013867 [Chlamydomonas incerta]